MKFTFVLPLSAPADVTSRLTLIIQRYWDCFHSAGVSKPIIGVQFSIDTGAAQPCWCSSPPYGMHERRIMTAHITTLLELGWIQPWTRGAWASMIVLAPKPHQEDIVDIEDFVWRFCISYRKLNALTLPFKVPIPSCADAIEDLGSHDGQLHFITLDAGSGFHQITVADDTIDKLAFYGPDHIKYTWNVMPFGPLNAPPVYITFMLQLRSIWTRRAREHPSLRSAFYGSNQIVDDTLIWSNSISAIFTFLEIVLQVCTEFRVSLKLKKCTFFDPRLEFVGIDLSANGHLPAASKYSLINSWPLPECQRSLTSFIGLCGFYNRFIPWFEVRIKPLRVLIKRYSSTTIPLLAWTQPLLKLFAYLKSCITSDPCLAIACSSKPFFLKTDWSSAGMGWILMQPDDSAQSIAALADLRAGLPCDFDTSLLGPRLRPVAFGSRPCSPTESRYHSMTGECAAGRFAVRANHKYLWAIHFYWLGDCSSLQAIFDYSGSQALIRRWAQELLGYNFTILHRPSAMMKDVDAVSRWCVHEPLILHYEQVAANLRLRVFPGPFLHSIVPDPAPTPSARHLLRHHQPDSSATTESPIPSLCHLPCLHQPGRAHPVQIPCYIASPSLPSNAAWLREYEADPCTNLLLTKLRPPSHWSKAEISSLPVQYREPIRTNRIFWSNHRLCLSHTKSESFHGALIVIVIPRGLRLFMFRALHSSPVAGHMGRDKTFYRMRIRFTFPLMYSFVRSAVDSCAHCILANSVVRESSELMYPSPSPEPFSVIHIDLWAPGVTVSPSGNSYVLVCMDELTGFVYVTPIPDSESRTLAKHFMEFLLRFGLCSIVVVDAASTFRGNFKLMCDALNLTIVTLAKRNHQAMRVERFLRFLNKVSTIASSDRDTPAVFEEASFVASYAWNSAPIDGTDIVRSFPAIGRILRFPIDCDPALVPTVEDSSSAVVQFLALSSHRRTTASSILRFLLDDRRSAHRERVNASRTASSFRVGDFVTARVQQQSNRALGRVQKLLYKAKGPFRITEVCEHGSYLIQHADKPQGPAQKFHARDLLPLPAVVHPFQSPDHADLRYLNLDFAPRPHPLDALSLTGFNSRFFNHITTSPVPSDASTPESTPFPSVATLDSELLPAIPSTPIPDPASATSVALRLTPLSASILHTATDLSTAKLFFIAYAPATVMRKKWYLVRVDFDMSAQDPLSRDFATSGVYYVEFLAKCSSDSKQSDSLARWWLEWRKFKTLPGGDIDLEPRRTEFRPNRTVNLAEYTPFGDTVNLLDPSLYMLGPFEYLKPARTTRAARYTVLDRLPLPTWQQLFDLCPYFGVAAPSMSPPSRSSIAFSYFTNAHLITRPSSILRTIQRQHRNRSVSLFTSSKRQKS